MRKKPLIAIVIAGGRALRIGGGDKSLLPVGGSSILQRVISTVRGQADHLVINANGDPARFGDFGCPVIPDTVPGLPGPLAGVLAGLDYVVEHHSGVDVALTVPGDVPFLPSDLVARLAERQNAEGASIVCARSNERNHGVVALWSVALRDDLRRALLVEGERKVDAFARHHAAIAVTWASEPIDPFLNVNTPEDLARAEQLARLGTAQAGAKIYDSATPER